jgi:hypothetical protein
MLALKTAAVENLKGVQHALVPLYITAANAGAQTETVDGEDC